MVLVGYNSIVLAKHFMKSKNTSSGLKLVDLKCNSVVYLPFALIKFNTFSIDDFSFSIPAV